MKYLSLVILVVIVVMFPYLEKKVGGDELKGEIESFSEIKSEPLPHKIAKVATPLAVVEAVVYDSNVTYEIGERVILQEDAQFSGLYSVTDKVRTGAIFQLLLLFVVVIVGVSGMAGIRSLLGLLFSFVVIFKFVLPQIVLGSNPLSVALLASCVILSVSYYLTHGISSKSSIAIVGTLGALVVTGLLASFFAQASFLSGFGSEEAGFLLGKLSIPSFYNLLLAGIIIGSLGVLDDITISQAAIVEELSLANKKLDIKELYLRAMRIGHDHISSLVNTLVLVYAGSALPLLVLFVSSEASVFSLLNYEAVAEEIVRTLVGSIGLVSAVPLTTIIAAYWYGQKR